MKTSTRALFLLTFTLAFAIPLLAARQQTTPTPTAPAPTAPSPSPGANPEPAPSAPAAPAAPTAPTPPPAPETPQPAQPAPEPTPAAPTAPTLPETAPGTQPTPISAAQAPTRPPVVSASPTRGRLGAYIPVTSANTPLGFHPDFAKAGGWEGFARDLEPRLREGRYTTALVWRPHGQRPGGMMPLDAMLYLSPTAADPIERAAADERAFIASLKHIKAVLDTNAGAPNRGELWVYLGNLEQAGPNEKALRDLPAEERIERIKRVLHPLRAAGVDGVAVDASGPAAKGSIEEETAKLILAEGFALVGYEGWAEKGKSEHWCEDPRYTGFLMSYWYSERSKFYPEKSKVRGRLALINTATLGQRKWSANKDESIAFIRDATANGFDVYVDVWSISEMMKSQRR